MPAADNRPRSSIYLTYDQITVLRNLAEKLGYFQTRGAGTGTVGSVSALLAGLALAYESNPGGVETFLSDQIAQSKAWVAAHGGALEEELATPASED